MTRSGSNFVSAHQQGTNAQKPGAVTKQVRDRAGLVLRLAGSALHVPADERLDGGASLVVGALPRRALHQVGGGPEERAADAAVLGDLRRPDRVDDDAGRVGGVPHLELVLQV